MISLVPAPKELAKYDLLEEIGHGGMATVFRARDRRLEREVALKLLHRHLRESAEIEARFSGEARAVAKLRHPNIVAVYDVSAEDEPERYLVMELVRGMTLRQLLKERGSLPVEVAAAAVLEIAAALEHAHQEGVVHRDIKPENVLIDMVNTEPASGADVDPVRIKLTDFGIAKLLDGQGVTSTGQVLGSPAHMAPEQIEGTTVDQRADVFSLGVLFYESIVGRLPFEGKNPAQVLRNVLEGNYEPAARANPKVGERWSAIITRALEREPEKRHQHVRVFAEDVRKELERVGMSNVRREVAAFLDEPEAYGETFTDRVVEGLKRSGAAARNERDVPLACAQYNRALAYRPADKDLLRQVSGLRRRERVLKGSYLLAAGGSLAALLVAVVHWWPITPDPTDAPPAKPPTAAETKVSAATATGVKAQPAASASQPQTPAPAAPKSRPRPRTGTGLKPIPVRSAPKPSEEPPVVELGATRKVSIRIRGAAGGSVKIDGAERPWFGGVVHELSVGEHLFEFVPPNPSCCEATTQRVKILEGEDVQRVVGEIPFRDARLDMRSGEAEGWYVRCPTLFSGNMALPGLRRVPMSRVKVTGTCVLTNSQENSATREKVVTLAAGQTTILAWP